MHKLVWFLGAVALLSVPDAAAQDVATGCLTRGGKIIKVAVGDQPARPCRSRETEIVLRLDGDDDSGPRTVRFFITLDGDGSEQTIASNGPLEIFVRCSLDDASIGGVDRVVFLVTSTIDGWWINQAHPSLAGQELRMADFRNNVGGQALFNGRDNVVVGSNSVIAPGGYLITIDFEEVASGLHIFDHDCLAAGMVTMTQGPLE